jgi:hypothetical protein
VAGIGLPPPLRERMGASLSRACSVCSESLTERFRNERFNARQFARFRVKHHVRYGQGAFGATFLAHDLEREGQRVAAKRVRLQDNNSTREDMQREVDIVMALHHEHIVQALASCHPIVENKVAQTLASWLWRLLSRRQIVPQAARSFGQPRSASVNQLVGPQIIVLAGQIGLVFRIGATTAARSGFSWSYSRAASCSTWWYARARWPRRAPSGTWCRSFAASRTCTAAASSTEI